MAKRLILVFVKIAIFSSLIGLVYVVYALNSRLDDYDVKNDYKNLNLEVSYNEGINTFKSTKNNNSIDSYIKCFENPINEEEFTYEMSEKLKEIYELFSDDNFVLSFAYEDLYTGLHISYNENQTYFTASTIKAPVALYIYKSAEEGQIDLNNYLTYTGDFYVEGSGSIQNEPIGTQYQLKDLLKRTVVESDNIAYQMLAYAVNYNDIKKFWNDLGAANFWSDYVWGSITAHDGIIYMKEIYNYYLTNTALSDELISYLENSVFKLINPNDTSLVAHKSGWHYEIMHDTALVFDEYPYAIVILTDEGNGDFVTFFNKASRLIDEFHDIYWQQKSNICYNKNFN